MLVETGRVAGPRARDDRDPRDPRGAGVLSCTASREAAWRRRPSATCPPSRPASTGRSRWTGSVACPSTSPTAATSTRLVPAAAVGLTLEPAAGARIVEVGERIRARIEAEVPLVHPGMPDARGLLYIQFYEPARRRDAQLRNAVVVAPAGLDRSPCGTGTSARLANLHARGALGVGEPFGHESIIGSLFVGRIAELDDGGREARYRSRDHGPRLAHGPRDAAARSAGSVSGGVPRLARQCREFDALSPRGVLPLTRSLCAGPVSPGKTARSWKPARWHTVCL